MKKLLDVYIHFYTYSHTNSHTSKQSFKLLFRMDMLKWRGNIYLGVRKEEILESLCKVSFLAIPTFIFHIRLIPFKSAKSSHCNRSLNMPLFTLPSPIIPAHCIRIITALVTGNVSRLSRACITNKSHSLTFSYSVAFVGFFLKIYRFPLINVISWGKVGNTVVFINLHVFW